MSKRAGSPIPTVPKKLITQEKICDNWHAHFHSSNPVDSNILYILQPTDVVKGSFIIYKPLTHLDLALGEYGRLEKTCYTIDSYRSQQFPRRYVLYKYHLDLPKKQDDILCKNVTVCYHANLCYMLRTWHSYIVTAIQKSNDKVKTLCKFFEMFNFTNGSQIRCLELIANKQGDSRLISRCLEINNEIVKKFFFTSYNPRLVDFALYHTTCAKRRIFNNISLDWRQTPTFKSTGCFYELIKYGYSYPYVPGNFLPCLKDAVKYHINPHANSYPSRVFLSSYHRQNIFLLTLLLLFRKQPNQQHSDIERLLKIFWQSIPDPYLTPAEISRGSDELQCSKTWNTKFTMYYKRKISSGCLQLKPRPLVHLCSCIIPLEKTPL
ncbi:SOCS box domain-containing protein [Trichonephila inaurata madagascariensis]|uniref:SOCS box domain-containing protein n=1 Tax=Trichonephila inaurata madagascariensis TaxID=2747483 RepID=A0A8X7C2A2_9ARAC|nr:SOCS box domain-containing protein [Trichonephila inaurata madagascariensis]